MSFLKNILDTSLGKDFWNYRLGQMVSLLGDSCSNIALANIPIGTQITLSVPDSHLARVGSIMGFLGAGITPLGIAAAGLLISKFGLTISLVAMGGLLVLLTPLMFIIPKFAEFIGAPPSEAATFIQRYYPKALDSEPELSSAEEPCV